MRRIRVIPVLLIFKGGLVKTAQFKNPKYVGDPINAVKIFNDKEVDELVVIDIDATAEGRTPNFTIIKEIVSEAFMPISYGGGISNLDQVKTLLQNGVEKVILNHSAFCSPNLITEIASNFGAQSIVVSIDYKKNIWGKSKVYIKNGKDNTGFDPLEFAQKCEDAGAGEIILQSIEREGTYKGYDLEMIQTVSSSIGIPVVACGGARDIQDFKSAVDHGASAVAAGSMFVFHGALKGVLINYPIQSELKDLFI